MLFKVASGTANVRRYEDSIRYQVVDLPTTYLGLPLGAKYKSKAIWNPVIIRVERKLVAWKRGYLSKRVVSLLLFKVFYQVCLFIIFPFLC